MASAKRDAPIHAMKRVAVTSTIQLIGNDGTVVGETSGIQMNVYGG